MPRTFGPARILQNAEQLPSERAGQYVPRTKPRFIWPGAKRRPKQFGQANTTCIVGLIGAWRTWSVTCPGRKTVPDELFRDLAPFLRAVDSPAERRKQSSAFDARSQQYWAGDGAPLPQIHCFYEVLSEPPTIIASLPQ